MTVQQFKERFKRSLEAAKEAPHPKANKRHKRKGK
jgi:hypothetical protein